MKKLVRGVAFSAVIVCIIFLTGCMGGGNIANIKTGLKAGTLNKTQTILVKEFEMADTVFSGDNAKNPMVVMNQKKQIASHSKSWLISILSNKGFNAVDYKDAPKSADAVIIEGKFTRINNGSGAVRFIVGLGAGAAWMEGDIVISSNPSIKTVLAEFQTQSSTQGSASPANMTDFLTKQFAKTIAEYIEKNS